MNHALHFLAPPSRQAATPTRIHPRLLTLHDTGAPLVLEHAKGAGHQATFTALS